MDTLPDSGIQGISADARSNFWAFYVGDGISRHSPLALNVYREVDELPSDVVYALEQAYANDPLKFVCQDKS